MPQVLLRQPAELTYAQELAQLQHADQLPRLAGWKLSPRAVVEYLAGNDRGISVKYIGHRSQLELAVAALTTDRALLLTGPPGTGKSWLAEHLAAAISGNSSLMIQGTAGTREEALRYGWNYARLIAEGPTRAALVASPILQAMETGALVRLEELTRLPTEVQDALLSILSEKALAIPELNLVIRAKPGFNLIATANESDRGIYPLSQALRRRFCTVKLIQPATLDEEVSIVLARLSEQGKKLKAEQLHHQTETIVTIFRELRSGRTSTGEARHGTPSSTLSVAEAIDVVEETAAQAIHFDQSQVQPQRLAQALQSAIVKDASRDLAIWQEYCKLTLAKRPGCKELAQACLAIK